jgi:hypothetical protein
MPNFKSGLHRFKPALLALSITAGMVHSLRGDDQQGAPAPEPEAASAPAVLPAAAPRRSLADLSAGLGQSSQSATVSLINRLVERGVLSKQDSGELIALAEADAAEARAQAAMTQAAIAMAVAAEARAKAIAAQAGYRRGAQTGQAAGASPRQPQEIPAPEAADTAADTAAAPAAHMNDDLDGQGQAPQPQAPVRKAARTAKAKQAVAQAQEAPEPSVPDDTVRVTYVPEFVKQQLREEVKQDVLDEAHKEGWATPSSVPDWISRFSLFGDFRLRYESYRYPNGNDNTGAFPNFNAINTGAPFDTAGGVFSPQINADQDRTRLRLRARLGAEVDLGKNFSVGLRAGTGQDDQPVSENQTLGYAGAGQGGNFSKYQLWLDRAFLKYEIGGLPDADVTLEFGRFDNPFMSTTMIWADDLAFDGIMAKAKYHVGEDITPFITMGLFPVFNTDLNFSTNQPAKFASYDKWLDAVQAGVSLDLGKSFNATFAAAYYYYHHIEGQLSSPFTPLTSSDQGNTDDSRPSFAQFGNTYMALRDIVPGPLNNNGLIDQFQYFGLATPFHELAFNGRLEFNEFEPFQVALTGEYVKNLAFNALNIAPIAVNNRGPSATANPANGPYVGGAAAWLVKLTLGDALLQNSWDWNVNLGYRSVASDAIVDGFADADFGGGGTNFKGPTLGGSLALTSDVWLRVVWMSASTVGGPTLKNDILQVDVNAKF